ncbi:hypothetical protein INT45_001690 [Circinella minor]|uniref:Galactose oxidase n=1 Tax=Circinella minor TaxID=1195481 RepID=A0A8H7S7Q6_9FUNG|nr:hypothetical protein INT45_001690 [Circinella minor]
MQLLIWWWSIIISTLLPTSVVMAAYNMTNEQINILPGRSSGATFVKDDKMYIYGGVVSRSVVSTQFTSISINEKDGSLIYEDVPQINPIPMSYNQPILLPDNNRLLMFGGITDNATLYTGKLLVYEYRFDQKSWKEAPALPYKNATFPVNRKEFTATLGMDGKVYITGGYNLVSAFNGAGSYVMGDLWSYDPENGQFVDLSQPLEPGNYMIGHTAIALPNNKIVFTMGTMGYRSRSAHPSNPTEQANTSLIYDITINKWTRQELKGDTIPWLREGVSAILGPDDSTIYFFGGVRDFAGYPYNPLANLAILDTNTWTWQSIDNVMGVQPTARYEANAALLKGKYVVIANGRTETLWYNDLYILSLPNNNSSVSSTTPVQEDSNLIWIENVIESLSDSNNGILNDNTSLSTKAIAGIVVGIIIGLILLFILWKYWSVLFTYFIWNPRTGEPRWTELSHLFSKLVLAALFGAFIAFLIVQVINSPISTITLTSPVTKVQVPDIRFCFDGWDKPSVGCQTDTGAITDCYTSGYLRQLNMTKHRPFFIDSQPSPPTCYLFTAPDDFQLNDPKSRQLQQQTSNNSNNGQRIQFMFYGVATKPNIAIHGNSTASLTFSRIHVSLYPRGRNPNLAYYFDDTTQKMSKSDIQTWLDEERNDLQTSSSNTYTLELGAYSTIAYQLQEHLYLNNDNGWNSIGFAQDYNRVPELSSSCRPGMATQLRVESFSKNILDIYPSSYSNVILKEQKIYTVLSAIGSAGGLLTLLFTLDTFLFGVRPNSPWGFVHHVSMGSARESLLSGLRNHFGFLSSTTPFINPVRSEFLPNQKQRETHNIIATKEPSNNINSTMIFKQQQQDEKVAATITNSNNSSNNNDTLSQEENQQFKQQLEELQRRIQLMELMLKSYYINDELFSNLNSAVNNDNNNNTTRNQQTTNNSVNRFSYKQQEQWNSKNNNNNNNYSK